MSSFAEHVPARRKDLMDPAQKKESRLRIEHPMKDFLKDYAHLMDA